MIHFASRSSNIVNSGNNCKPSVDSLMLIYHMIQVRRDELMNISTKIPCYLQTSNLNISDGSWTTGRLFTKMINPQNQHRTHLYNYWKTYHGHTLLGTKALHNCFFNLILVNIIIIYHLPWPFISKVPNQTNVTILWWNKANNLSKLA